MSNSSDVEQVKQPAVEAKAAKAKATGKPDIHAMLGVTRPAATAKPAAPSQAGRGKKSRLRVSVTYISELILQVVHIGSECELDHCPRPTNRRHKIFRMTALAAVYHPGRISSHVWTWEQAPMSCR